MSKKLVIVKYIQNGSEGLDFSSHSYAYTIVTMKKINEGDFIVIRDRQGTPNEDRKGISVVKVIKTFADVRSSEALQFIEYKDLTLRDKEFLGKADIKDYFDEIEKKHKRKELQEKIEKHFKEAEKEALYRKLAETDPEMKALLAELDSLK